MSSVCQRDTNKCRFPSPVFARPALPRPSIKENRLTHEDIFQELPLTIHNNSLVDVFIRELAAQASAGKAQMVSGLGKCLLGGACILL